MRTVSRRTAFGAAALVCVVLSCAAPAADRAHALPDWTLPDGNGAPVNFHTDSAGKGAVLLFWASWCPHCRNLMPYLEDLRADFDGNGIRFYALNVWEDGDPAAYLRQHGFGFRLLLGADEVADGYGIRGTPGLIVVDRGGRVVYVRRSGTKPAAVARELRAVLGRIAADTPPE